ncbi:MAG: hypothetical protein ACJA13_000875 [Paraglaciecola sp.]|jgi:hypothetical protein
MKIPLILLLFGCIALSACQTIDSGTSGENADLMDTQRTNIFDTKMSLLVDKLTALEKFDYKKKSSLITTLVWSDSLRYKNINHPLKLFGHQMAESIKINLVNRNSKIIEHQSSSAISVSKNATYFLSRDINELKSYSEADYVIAGTYTEMEGGAMVYVEVIELKSSEIVGAAQDFFPSSLFWATNKISARDGNIYREN